ncbi:Uncharacterised protein [Yersinia frederiksenii]|nr:Uncharacterised protein [Yersinia frederiksenii]
MKELDSFTVEDLKEIINSPANELTIALARIALSAKQAEPVAWLLSGGGAKNIVTFDSGNAYVDPLREVTPLYTAPHLNPPEIPEGWKLTPINPTAEMMAAAMECDDVVFDLDDDTIFCVQFDNIYAAMLAAAPEKPL